MSEISKRFLELACGIGWDRPASPDPNAARALLASERRAVLSDVCAAAAAGEAAVVRELIEGNASLATSRSGPRDWPPLLWAAFSVLGHGDRQTELGIRDATKILLENGADPNSHYLGGIPPCVFPALYACIAVSKNLELAELLLEAGAKPSDTQSLYHACETFDLRWLRLLERYALDPDDVSYCLKHALDVSWEDAIRWFLDQGADPDAIHPEKGETSLHWAVMRAATPKVVRWLLEAGADPNARTKDGRTSYLGILCWTPHDLARRLGATENASLMESFGARPSAATEVETLLFACARGDGETARTMIGEDPDLLSRLSTSDRRLMPHVAQQRNTDGVVLMLELGFDARARGWMNATPLHWGCCLGEARMVDALLRSGVPQEDVAGYFGTPLNTALYRQWSREGDYPSVLRALLEAGAEVPADWSPTGRADVDTVVESYRAR
ncbi:MAG: ankyrin repeat domain-containing protein [Planctomycetota bacterium]